MVEKKLKPLQNMCSSKGACTSKLCIRFTTSRRAEKCTHKHKNKQQLQRKHRQVNHTNIQHCGNIDLDAATTILINDGNEGDDKDFIEAGSGGGFDNNIVQRGEESGGEYGL